LRVNSEICFYISPSFQSLHPQHYILSMLPCHVIPFYSLFVLWLFCLFKYAHLENNSSILLNHWAWIQFNHFFLSHPFGISTQPFLLQQTVWPTPSLVFSSLLFSLYLIFILSITFFHRLIYSVSLGWVLVLQTVGSLSQHSYINLLYSLAHYDYSMI
jgi:hypothetical protein